MPRGVPKLGARHIHQAQTSAAGDLMEAPQPQVLGSIASDTIKQVTDERPPWEIDDGWKKHNTNARQFVTVPDSWELRWLNPALIEHIGTRDWRAVVTEKGKVTIKRGYEQMVSPEGYIRKGGSQKGLILFYMPKSWVESRQRIKELESAKLKTGAVNRAAETAERINRGEYGQNVGASVRHPSHTIGDGRSMTD